MDTGASRILAMQSVLITLVVWGFYAHQGQLAAQAACYGGGIVLFNVWMMNRRVQKAIEVAENFPGKEVHLLYAVAVQRFFLTIGFFIVGMGWLEWPPVPMLVAFSSAQLGYFLSGHPYFSKSIISKGVVKRGRI
ncbi:MAG: hypothetical protein BWK79_12410 [Beggiatoa sp. IS2]|nr:MAG: hypothetical protein BWK79_12410 [Beggiatoa sp. IS2]